MKTEAETDSDIQQNFQKRLKESMRYSLCNKSRYLSLHKQKSLISLASLNKLASLLNLPLRRIISFLMLFIISHNFLIIDIQ